MTHAEGNVIHHDFGHRPTPPPMSFTCETLYADEHVALLRLTYRLAGRTLIQHVASGAGLDD